MATVSAPSPAEPELREIVSETGLTLPDLRELREYQDLVYFLVKRDISVRYRQTAAGGLWAVIQPAALAAVFSIFLGLLAKVPSEGDIPYPLYAFSGMVMWLYFSISLQKASEGTVAAAGMISKVYFPRIIIPLVAAISPILDFLIGFTVLLVVMTAYGFPPGPEVLLMPFALLLAFGTAFGAGLWFSALHVKYRDIQHLVPFMLLTGLFVTPIIYPFSLVPTELQPIYALNPMVGVLEVYRWMLFGEMSADAWLVAIPVAASLVLIVTGALYFKRAERSFADLI